MAAACNFTIPQWDCTLQTCCLEQATVRYIPTLGGNSAYLAIFALILALQIGLGVRYRTWGFVVGMFCGLMLEVLGYAGRIQMHSNPFDQNPFLMYLICLTIGPAFLAAAIYLCLARIVKVYGTHFSRIQPRMYTITFISCDLVSLILQAAGGAIASIADDKKTNDLGVHILIAGLAFQVFSLALFMGLCAEFALRVHRSGGEKEVAFSQLRNSFKFKAFQFALAIATLTIFTRSVYRVAELAGGFDGALANDEVLFEILEGPMIMIATISLTIFHPGLSFTGLWSAAGWSLRTKKNVHAPEDKISLESRGAGRGSSAS